MDERRITVNTSESSWLNPNGGHGIEVPTIKLLNVDKIKDLDDVKRVLEYMHITAKLYDRMEPRGYSKVEDLFEW